MNQPPAPAPERREVPAPLTVAVSLAALEAIVLVLQGLALVAALERDRLSMGLTSTVFFVVYGGFLGFCAWRAYRLASWARAPLVLAQLIQILVGVNFWGGSTTPVAAVLIAIGVLTLVGLLHPASIDALSED